MTKLRMLLATTGAAIAMATSLSAPLHAQTTQPTPELQAMDDALPGTLINDPSRLDWAFYGADGKTKTVRNPNIPGGGAAVQMTVARKGANFYDVGGSIPLTAKITSGKDYTVAFYARTVSSSAADGKGRVNVTFQQNSAPYPGFGSKLVEIGSEWKLYEVTARADRDIAKDVAIISLHFGAEKQIVEIGQTIVVEGATSIMKSAAAAAVPPNDPEMPEQLVGLGTMLNDFKDRNWNPYGPGLTSKPTVTNVFGRIGTDFNVTAVGANPWDAAAAVPITQPINEGDILTIAIVARTVSAQTPDGKAIVSVRIQSNEAPYPGFLDKQIRVGSNWGLIQLRTRATQTIAAGKGVVALQLAGAVQDVEFGPIYVIHEKDAPAK